MNETQDHKGEPSGDKKFCGFASVDEFSKVISQFIFPMLLSHKFA